MKIISIPEVNLEELCYSNPKRYPFLLESVNDNYNNRYSILFAFPEKTIKLNNLDEFDFLQNLQNNIDANNQSCDLPFSGGWFVYFSYELIGQIEPIIRKNLYTGNLPIAIAVKITTAIIIDKLEKKTYIFNQFDNDRVDQILSDISHLNFIKDKKITGNLNWDNEDKFISGVNKIIDYIKAGDVFQVNLSRQWKYYLDIDISSTQIYKYLKKSNPAPFSALAQFDEFDIISSSPELLFKVDGQNIETRPIAGTCPRESGEKDEKIKNKLLNHPKEQAEHIMILDLERNDLGKVCEYGSINVDEIMTLESYSYVHHIVSNIKGKLKKNAGIKDIVKALFPGGTITGCPKVRCMQIISELEKAPRQAYTGSLGYISNNGKMNFNILIRTIVKQNKTLTLRAGAGIVFDSLANRELDETKHKAQGILKIFDNK